MNPFLKIFDIVPGFVYAILLAGVFAFSTVTSVRLAGAQVEVANLKEAASANQVERERVAREDSEKTARVQFRHAEIQQENSNEAIRRDAARVAHERDLAADNQRLRDDILAASRGGPEAAADPAACGRDCDLARQFGADLAEAVGLQGEAAAALRKRDDEVKRLLDQIHTDRAAVEAQ